MGVLQHPEHPLGTPLTTENNWESMGATENWEFIVIIIVPIIMGTVENQQELLQFRINEIDSVINY